MTRYGKPTKNKKRIDPRHFLEETTDRELKEVDEGDSTVVEGEEEEVINEFLPVGLAAGAAAYQAMKDAKKEEEGRSAVDVAGDVSQHGAFGAVADVLSQNLGLNPYTKDIDKDWKTAVARKGTMTSGDPGSRAGATKIVDIPSEVNLDDMAFKDAFNYARENDMDTFNWQGAEYGTQLASTVDETVRRIADTILNVLKENDKKPKADKPGVTTIDISDEEGMTVYANDPEITDKEALAMLKAVEDIDLGDSKETTARGKDKGDD